MAGQESRAFRNASGQTPDTSGLQPSVGYQAATPAAAALQGREAGALSQLSNTFGNFFNTAQATLEKVNNINEYGRRTEIQRENEALKKKAVADATNGLGMDQQYVGRADYHDTFQGIVGQDQAQGLLTDARKVLQDMPVDGSADPTKVLQDFYQQNWGRGTGDQTLDAQVAHQFMQGARQMAAQKNEQIFKTQEEAQNAQFYNNVNTTLNQEGGMTEANWAVLEHNAVVRTRGDTATANKLLVNALGSNIRNADQAYAILGAATKSGWAEKNPESYMQLSAKAAEMTHRVKTFEAQAQIDSWNADLQNGVLNGQAKDINWLARKFADGIDIDRNHGTGMSPFAHVESMIRTAASQQAQANLVAAVWKQQDGIATLDVAGRVAGINKDKTAIIKEQGFAGLSQLVQEPGMQQAYPELYQSTLENKGFVQPVKNQNTAREAAALVASDNGIRTLGYTMPKEFIDQGSMALRSTDKNAAATGFALYSAIDARVGENNLKDYFASSDDMAYYLGLKRLQSVNADIGQIATQMRDHPAIARTVEMVAKTGPESAIESVFGQKKTDVDDLMNKGLQAKILDKMGKGGLFSPNAALGPEQRREAATLLVQQGLIQQVAGKPDIKAAVDAVATTLANKYVTVPGLNGNLRLVEDTFGGRGRSVDHPLNANADFPSFNVHNGAPIAVAPGIVKNALGENENTVETVQKDMKDFAYRFPGKVDSRTMYLGDPNKVGLSTLYSTYGNPVTFHPDEEIKMVTKRNTTDTDWVPDDPMNAGSFQTIKQSRSDVQAAAKFPSTPEKAQEFVKENFGPAAYAIWDRPSNSYTVQFRHRVLIETKEQVQEILDKREKARARVLPFKEDNRQTMQYLGEL